MKKDIFPKIVSRKIIFRGNFFNIIQNKAVFTNKKIAIWHSIDWTHDSVTIVPVDDKNNVYFSRELRHAWARKITSLPSGGVKTNASEKENIKQVHDELREEIGFDAKKIEKLITVLDTGKTRHKIHIYFATNLFKSAKERDFDEIIEVVKMPIKKAYDLFLSGKKETTAYTVLGLMMVMNRLKMK